MHRLNVLFFALLLLQFFYFTSLLESMERECTQEGHEQLMLIYKLEEMSRGKYPEIQNEIFNFFKE